jgi:hypothetical protein
MRKPVRNRFLHLGAFAGLFFSLLRARHIRKTWNFLLKGTSKNFSFRNKLKYHDFIMAEYESGHPDKKGASPGGGKLLFGL